VDEQFEKELSQFKSRLSLPLDRDFNGRMKPNVSDDWLTQIKNKLKKVLQ
jgi:hypothetical protein